MKKLKPAQEKPAIGFSATRRQHLTRWTALGIGALFPNWKIWAQGPGNAAKESKYRIDVHHHILPPKYIEIVRDQFLLMAPGYERVLKWTPQDSIDEMDQNGVATAIVSTSGPGVWLGDIKQSRYLQRVCNEFAAEMVAGHPGRFGMFACIALPDLDGSLREIEYALDELKADGIGLFSNYGEKWPGDQDFAPIFDELNRRKTVVYVHPITADCCKALIPDVPDAMVEFPFDTTRAISSLLYSGTLSRCPDIRFIFSHGGGTVPMLADRMTFPERIFKNLADRLPHGAMYELKKLFYDTASVANPPAFAALSKLVANSQILFGTDYPFVPTAANTVPLSALGLSQKDLHDIERQNALALFPRFG